MKYVPYNFGHDEYDNSTKMLENWNRERNPNIYHRMPLGFGNTPGPRQDIRGLRQPSAAQTFVTATIRFRSSRTFLQNLFPNESFRFKSPATIVQASFKATRLGNMSWLGGGGYDHFGLYLHDVMYKKRDGSVADGTYLPVLFENLTDPILSGRDELGMPKVFCDLDVQHEGSSYNLQASWRGTKFASFAIENLQAPKADEAAPKPDPRTLVYKYVPAVGQPGKADVEYPVVISHDAEGEVVSKIENRETSTKASISFETPDFNQIPTLHHIVSKLAEIPIYGIVEASVVRGTGVTDLSAARRIE